MNNPSQRVLLSRHITHNSPALYKCYLEYSELKLIQCNTTDFKVMIGETETDVWIFREHFEAAVCVFELYLYSTERCFFFLNVVFPL